MKRAFVLVAVLSLAGCDGAHNTKKPGVKPSRPVTKPLGRPLVVDLRGSVTGTARVRSLGSTETSVSLKLAHASAKGLTAELDRGSCGAPKGLQLAKRLGPVSAATSGWSVTAPLTRLTASPLAVVLRSGGKLVGCGNVRQA
jgi:hypothetical protein